MDVGAPVEAVNESPEAKAEKETRPKKKTVRSAPARPASRTAGKPSSRAKVVADGAETASETVMPVSSGARSEAVADKPASA